MGRQLAPFDTSHGFVKFDREGSGQLVQTAFEGQESSRFIIEGFNAPEGLIESVSFQGEEGRRQVAELLQHAVALRLNTVRIKAYSHHLHPSLSQINEVSHRSLDFIIHSASLLKLRLILVLTGLHGESFDPHGAAQYGRWIDPAATLTDFFVNDTFKARYFDYISSIITRNNTLSGKVYHQDPTIIAWDLMDNVRLPGGLREGGDILQAWIAWTGSFVKDLKGDSPQLVMISSPGLFGPFSPHHLRLNPQRASIALSQPKCLDGPLDGAAPRALPSFSAESCDGSDYMRNNALWQIDVAHFSILPMIDRSHHHPQCEEEWRDEWIKAHLRDSLRMQKPVLISYSSHSYHIVRESLAKAESTGIAVAGSLLRSIQDHPRYTSLLLGEIKPSRHNPANMSSECIEAELSELRRFMNYDQLNICWKAEGLFADPPLSLGEQALVAVSGLTRKMLRKKQYSLTTHSGTLALVEAN